MSNKRLRSVSCLLLIAFAVLSCTNSKPAILISSPPSGMQFDEGDEVAIQVVTTHPTGVARVELYVDGVHVQTDHDPSNPKELKVVQTWKAAPGTHIISVISYDTAGRSSDPAAISITVYPSTTSGGTPVPPAEPRGRVVTTRVAAQPAPRANMPAGTNAPATRTDAQPIQPVNPTIVRIPTITQQPVRVPTFALPLIPPYSRQVTKQIPVPAHVPGTLNTGSVRAPCPTGSIVTGGGFHVDSPEPGLTQVQSSSQESNGWMVTVYKQPSLITLTAYAVCVSLNPQAWHPVTSNLVSVPPGTFGGPDAVCPPGSQPTGGGFLENSSHSHMYWIGRAINGWRVLIEVPPRAPAQSVRASAICYDGARSIQVFIFANIPPKLTGSATAACPSGTIVTGGGYATNLGLVVYSNQRQGNGWQAFAKNNTENNSGLFSRAICTAF